MSATIGLISAGEMGAGIGGALTAAGKRVITVLEGRGAETRARAAEAGLAEAPDLEGLVAESAIVLSIVPPASARATAEAVVVAMGATGATPIYVECNAIAPAASAEIAALVSAAGAEVVDGGIIGMPPPSGAPRLYLSGAASERLAADLACDGFMALSLGERYGDASSVKMTYAAMTKGLNALIAGSLLTAERLDVLAPLLAELQSSQPDFFRRANNVSRLPADSARWAPEMEEISRTFAAVGAPGAMHQGCAELMALLARSPYAAETRRTIDGNRTMETTVREIAKLMRPD